MRASLFLVNDLFTKRTVCTQCLTMLSYDDKTCNKCVPFEHKRLANIFDVNQPLVFARMLDRLMPDIDAYRIQIAADHLPIDNDNDIVFNALYRELKQTMGSTPFISLILHLDGINLSKSSKLTLWLLSCSLIELPPRLRYRRGNMIVLSAWIGPCEPKINLWLDECLLQLNCLKQAGICECFIKI